MNDVTLSPDNLEMTIISEDGRRKCTVRSERPDGFTDEHVRYAMFEYQFCAAPGTHTARKKTWFGRDFTVHTSVGRPTWWLPKVDVGRGHVMVGWLRGMAAVRW